MSMNLKDYDNRLVKWLLEPYQSSDASEDFNAMSQKQIVRDLALATLEYGRQTENSVGEEHIRRKWVMNYDDRAAFTLVQDLTYAGEYPAKRGILTQFELRMDDREGNRLVTGKEDRVYDFGAASPTMAAASLYTFRRPDDVQRLRDDIFKADVRGRAARLTI